MTVKDYLSDLDDWEDTLDELAQENNYWFSCQQFVEKNLHKEIDEMTDKQVNWLHKIFDGLEEQAGSRKLYE